MILIILTVASLKHDGFIKISPTPSIMEKKTSNGSFISEPRRKIFCLRVLYEVKAKPAIRSIIFVSKLKTFIDYTRSVKFFNFIYSFSFLLKSFNDIV